MSSVPETLLERLVGEWTKKGTLAGMKRLPARAARYADWPAAVPEKLREAFAKRGIERPYVHQARAAELALSGKDFVVVTPTASGKTLCYNLPVLKAMLDDPSSRALYLFPTKALSQDQVAELDEVIAGTGSSIKAHTFDGDTPDDARRAIRASGQIVVTNPDMLHQGVLPHHTKWAKLFQNLKYVVVDELHTYRGVFGSHLANVFRRLKRICRFHGSDPKFILCSATIANPKELAEKLVERPVELIDENGAPAGEKLFLIYNPPIVNRELGIRGSYVTAARRIAEEFIRAGVQTIVFATSRLNAEVLTTYLKERFEKLPHDAGRIRAYRGGLLPNTRREIERQLRAGMIQGVVSTNALELGIDIGALDAAVIAGYPGTIASLWQQAGRAGRRNGLSVAAFVARSEPMDQFLAAHPDYFFGRSPEHGLVNPDNLSILVEHLKCACFELPVAAGEAFGPASNLGNVTEILGVLGERKLLHQAGGAWHWASQVYPADTVPLRSVNNENFVIMDQSQQNRVIAEVDFESAPATVYPEAIYLCESKPYHVVNLDYAQHRAYVKPVDVDYYTEAITNTSVRVIDIFDHAESPAAKREHGEVHVAWRVSGFKKIKFATRENVGYGDVQLPDQEMQTTSYWFTIEPDSLKDLGFGRADLLDGTTGLAYLLHHLAPFLLMCDRRDLHHVVGDTEAEWFAIEGQRISKAREVKLKDASVPVEALATFRPTIFLYDSFPGGVGFSQALWELHPQLMARAKELLEACPCSGGCPSCVGPANETGGKAKEVATAMLAELAGVKRGGFEPAADSVIRQNT
ncbi:MAG: DEAD/DEAH box helicase domain-containing [Planctomycetota bacterium]|nr:MAG: DEAD/DEAH box helicase domain-containing [Planctomycetota bacterium]